MLFFYVKTADLTCSVYCYGNIKSDAFLSEYQTATKWRSDNFSGHFLAPVRNLARSTWTWLVYGEMMFFALPDYGHNSADWNIQKFRNPSVTSAISVFHNNKAATVLKEPCPSLDVSCVTPWC